MAGGNGKGNNVIELRPQHKIAIDKIEKVLKDEILPRGLTTQEVIKDLEEIDESTNNKVFLEEDPYIKFLALQYKAYMARRTTRYYETRLEFTSLTFADYVDIKEGR